MIKEAKKSDSAVLAALALYLWQEHSLSSFQEEFEKLTEAEDSVCFIKYMGGIICFLKKL